MTRMCSEYLVYPKPRRLAAAIRAVLAGLAVLALAGACTAPAADWPPQGMALPS